MAKTALSRHHANRLSKNWHRRLKSMGLNRLTERCSFGHIFSKDPLDCGRAKCPLCSNAKYSKKDRAIARQSEKEAQDDFRREMIRWDR